MTNELFQQILLLLEKYKFKITSYISETEMIYHDFFGHEVFIDKDWGISILDEYNETERVFYEDDINIERIKNTLQQILKN